MPIITRKIELCIDREGITDDEYKTHWQFLRQIDDNLYLVANRISSHYFWTDEFENRMRMQMPEYYKASKDIRKLAKKKMSEEEKRSFEQLKEQLERLEDVIKQKKEDFLCGTNVRTSIYRLVSEEYSNLIPTDILTNLLQEITGSYKEASQDIRKGNRTLSNYRKGMPIPFSFPKDKNPFIIRDEGENADILFKWFEKRSGICFKMCFGKDRSNNREIVKRLIADFNKNDGYKLNNSSIQLVNKNGKTKIFLLLSLTIPVQKRTLDKELVLGVDLGIKYPLYLATNGTAYIKRYIGDSDSFLNERLVFQRRYKELQRNLQCTGGGKGRGKKLQALEQLRDKERNWVKTKNHVFSREVIKFALKIGAGTIHLEKLTGIGRDNDGDVRDDRKFILRNWSYFELQTMIKYKAKMEGIEVRFVNPAYTSQTCCNCGERGERKEQAVFRCMNPKCSEYGKEINADYNAARNIALSKDVVAD